MTYQCDILYNVQDFEVDKAIVAFSEPLDVQWPLDKINEAMFEFTNVNEPRPWIYDIEDDGGSIGYIVTERDDNLTDNGLYEAFVGMLVEQDLYDAETLIFLRDIPFSCSGEWDGVTVGICAHPQRYGSMFPSKAVSRAIWMLAGQSDWSRTKSLYVYPVRKGGSSLMSGLIVQSAVDGVGENDLVDDVMFKDVAEQNTYPIPGHVMQFAPERMTIR